MKIILQTAISKLKQDPIGFFLRVFHKTLVAPLKYRTRDGYDAARYWSDRFTRHGTSLKGVGDEGLSEQSNHAMYEKAAAAFLDLCSQEGIDIASARVLEIGCGNGFYTGLLREQGANHYLGLDITDTLFPILAARFPGFRFIRRDITVDYVNGEFDLILMIDVIEHIVSEEKLDFAMSNVLRCLVDNGRFMVAPVAAKSRHSLFYVRFWTVEDIKKRLAACLFDNPIPFRDDSLLIARKSPKQGTSTG
jgi:SAM-dependent methyltransferase